MNGLSKRLVSLTMATAMVFSLTAVPATEASAATKTITAKTTSVQAGQTYTYSINAKKAKNVKISVSGAAKSGVTATVDGKKLSGKTLKGGKTLKVTIKANTKVVGKKFVVNYKLDKKATKKTKAIKVNYSAKSVSLDQTALTLEAGKTATLKATINPTTSNSTIKSWVSSDEKVVTVNNGVVTAVAAGTADITVTTSNGKTAKATVTVEEKKEEVKDTVPQMTALTATAADTLKATFASAVPADAAITITRSKSTAGFTGIATWNADRTELTYKLDTNLIADVYTMTVKVGESSTSLTYEATARKATSIEILGETALTNSAKDKAYVYYDVKDQYGESVRTSTSVTVTTSTGTQSTDRSSGKITITAAANTSFKYGDIVSVTIVDTKDGLSQSKVLNVGLEQNVDAVKVAGFINTDEPTKILNQLPENFAKDKYVVLYQALDQQGNVMDNAIDNLGANGADKQFTVTVSDPMLIDSTFVDAEKNYTVDGVTYDAFKINPGKYSDKGGEAVLTIISNKTGCKTPYTVVVTSASVLKSFALDAPSNTFADGETTTLTYTAKDTNDNDIKDFETIIRSTNTLNLNASVGTLTLSEGNDGELVATYSDTIGNRDLDDGVDMPVVLTTIVVGGETNYQQFGISDYAYPVAFKEIHTKRWTDTIVYGGSETIDFADKEKKGVVKYVDQYGRTIDGWDAWDKLAYVNNNTTFNTTLAIVMDTAGVAAQGAGNFGLDETVVKVNNVLSEANWSDYQKSIYKDYSHNYDETDISDSIRFYIGSTENSKNANPAFADLNAVGPLKTVTYTCVGYNKVKNIGIYDINTLHVSDVYSSYENLADFTKKTGNSTVSGDAVLTTTVENERWVCVYGKANNETVNIPMETWDGTQNVKYWDVASGSIVSVVKDDQNGKINGVTGLKLSDLYKTSTTTGDRLVKELTLSLDIAGVSGNAIVPAQDTIETTVKVSDANSVATTIKFYDGWWKELKDTAVVDPTKMDITSSQKDNKYLLVGDGSKDSIIVKVLDQYGDEIVYDNISNAKVKISDIKENTAALAHVANSIGTISNNTKYVKVVGAEIKDTFKLTVSAGNATATLDVTVGGDTWASMTDSDTATSSKDYNFRTGTLKYTDR